jgi:S-adenosylhomocysteine hydrolase
MDGSFANQVLAQMYLYEKAFADMCQFHCQNVQYCTPLHLV